MLKEFLLSATISAINPSMEYKEAASKAAEAAFTQTKLVNKTDEFDSFIQKEIMRQAEKTGVERELAAAAYAYKAYQSKAIALPSYKALLGSWNLTIGVENSKLGVTWIF